MFTGKQARVDANIHLGSSDQIVLRKIINTSYGFLLSYLGVGSLLKCAAIVVISDYPTWGFSQRGVIEQLLYKNGH